MLLSWMSKLSYALDIISSRALLPTLISDKVDRHLLLILKKKPIEIVNTYPKNRLQIKRRALYKSIREYPELPCIEHCFLHRAKSGMLPSPPHLALLASFSISHSINVLFLTLSPNWLRSCFFYKLRSVRLVDWTESLAQGFHNTELLKISKLPNTVKSSNYIIICIFSNYGN